jgi:hypothetical protein
LAAIGRTLAGTTAIANVTLSAASGLPVGHQNVNAKASATAILNAGLVLIGVAVRGNRALRAISQTVGEVLSLSANAVAAAASVRVADLTRRAARLASLTAPGYATLYTVTDVGIRAVLVERTLQAG